MKTAGCILLACSANVLKTLAAKLMSNHFYRDSYFDKMQDALCKVTAMANKDWVRVDRRQQRM